MHSSVIYTWSDMQCDYHSRYKAVKIKYKLNYVPLN